MNIDFNAINSNLLINYKSVLQQWLPDGHVRGSEYIATNPTRQDKEPGSFSVNIRTGIWKDFACGDGGGDPVSLYAYLHGLQQGEAAKQLAGMTSYAAQAQAPVKPVYKETEGEWQQIIPVPADAPPPPKVRKLLIGDEWIHYTITHLWEYKNREGGTVGFVTRYKTDNGKETPPLTLWKSKKDGKYKWRFKAFPAPRPLYNLSKIFEHPEAQIVVVEGEKCADILQGLFESNSAHEHICAVTWPGGCQAVRNADWSYLAGRKSIAWPDNDLKSEKDVLLSLKKQPGYKAMMTVAQLAGAEQFKICTPFYNEKPDGWDCYDAIIDDGWDIHQVLKYLKDNSIPVEQKKNKRRTDDRQPDDIQQISTKPVDITGQPFRCLGYYGDFHYYLPATTKQVKAIKAEHHSKGALMSMASLQYWETNYHQRSGPDWNQAGSDLQRQNEKVGIFDSSKVRGRGVWEDAGRVVVNLGDRLIVENEPSDYISIKSDYVYEAGVRLEESIGAPLSDTEARKFLELCRMLKWQNELDGTLLAGWVVSSIICGGLSWRSHAWLTGPAGTGKTYIIDKIIRRVIGNFAIFIQGGSTEAGIRQELRNDALAILFDEAEAEDEDAENRMQLIEQLMRQSSSMSGGKMLKGSQTGRAVQYQMNSSFLLSSIRVNIENYADKTRITVLELQRSGSDSKEHFNQLRERIGVLTDKYCIAFRSRCIQLLPTIIYNAEKFAQAAAEKLNERRHGDQLGTLIACAFSLTSSTRITSDAARKWIDSKSWENYQLSLDETEERRCLNTILQYPIYDKHGTFIVIELLQMCISGDWDCINSPTPAPLVGKNEAAIILKKNGIKIDDNQKIVHFRGGDDRGVSRFLTKTPWKNCWRDILLRIDGSESHKCIHFYGRNDNTSTVSLPLDKIVSAD